MPVWPCYVNLILNNIKLILFQTCVKNKAMQSVVVVRNVSIEKAMEIVDKVFDRCYYDLEPVGRIPRKYTRDADLALIEGELYGYTD